MRGKYVSFFAVVFTLMVSILMVNRVKASEEMKYIEGSEVGVIRQEIKLNDVYYLAVSTDRDVYLIKDDVIVFDYKASKDPEFIQVIPDLNGNGYDELLIITKDLGNNNIFLFDSKDQSIIFDYASTMNAFIQANGYVDRIVSVTDYQVEDHYAIFAAGYNLFKMDLKTGKVIWNTEATNNMWDIEPIGDINSDGVTDYAEAIQPTNVMAVSGKDGKILYNKAVSAPIEVDNKRVIPTSIWNLQYNPDTKKLYASSENGSVYLLKASSGKVERSKKIISVDKRLYSSYAGTSNSLTPFFRKLTIELTTDISGDGKRDLVYYPWIRFDRYQSDQLSGMKDINSKVMFLDGLTLSPLNFEASVKGSVYGSYMVKGMYKDHEVAFIMNSYDDQSITYRIFSLDERKWYDDTINLPNYNYLGGNSTPFSFVYLHDNTVAIFTQEGVIHQKASSATFIPKVTTIDFQNDKDHMLIQKGSGNIGDVSNKTFILEMRDLTNKLLWNYQMDMDDYYKTKGYQVDFSTDYNKDGYKDVVLLANQSGGNSNYIPTITVLDGKTGKQLSKQNIVIPENAIDYSAFSSYDDYLQMRGYKNVSILSYGFLNDVNNDGFKDYYVVNSMGEIFFLDLKQKSILNYFSPNNDLIDQTHIATYDFNNMFPISDLDGDHYNEFVKMTEVGYTIYSFKANSIELSDPKESTGEMNQVHYSLGDIDNDGFNDYVYVTGYDKQQLMYNIISSKTGTVIYQLSGLVFDRIYSSNMDINNDGVDEIFHITGSYDNKSTVKLLDIKNDEELYKSSNYQMYYYYEPSLENTNIKKSAVLFKTNGKYYVAIDVKKMYYDIGEDIKIYDINTKEEVKSIPIVENRDKYNNYYEPSLDTFDVVQDGDNVYFYKVNNENGPYYPRHDEESNMLMVYVYDYNLGKTIFQLSNEISKIFIHGDKAFIKTANNNISLIKMNQEISISNLTNGQKIDKSYQLKFDKSPGLIQIYVDNSLVGSTVEESYKLKMLEGKHTLKVSQEDESGIVHFYSVDVEVTKNNTYIILISTTTVILFAMAIILPRKTRKYKRPEVVVEGSDVNE